MKNVSSMKSERNVKNRSSYRSTGNPRGRPKKQRVFVNKPEIDASYANHPRKEGGGSLITIEDHDKDYNTDIMATNPSQVEHLKVVEEGHIITADATNKYGKTQEVVVTQTLHDPGLLEKRNALKKAILTESTTEVKKKYGITKLQNLAEEYGIKSTNRHDQKKDLIQLLRKRLLIEQEENQKREAFLAEKRNKIDYDEEIKKAQETKPQPKPRNQEQKDEKITSKSITSIKEQHAKEQAELKKKIQLEKQEKEYKGLEDQQKKSHERLDKLTHSDNKESSLEKKIKLSEHANLISRPKNTINESAESNDRRYRNSKSPDHGPAEKKSVAHDQHTKQSKKEEKDSIDEMESLLS